jgi:hypothetical protein
VLAALSSGHKLGLGLCGLAFVIFALDSAMVIPSSNPDFPRTNRNAFIAACFAFFVMMLAAVWIFGKSSAPPEKHNNEPTAAIAAPQ